MRQRNRGPDIAVVALCLTAAIFLTLSAFSEPPAATPVAAPPPTPTDATPPVLPSVPTALVLPTPPPPAPTPQAAAQPASPRPDTPQQSPQSPPQSPPPGPSLEPITVTALKPDLARPAAMPITPLTVTPIEDPPPVQPRPAPPPAPVPVAPVAAAEPVRGPAETEVAVSDSGPKSAPALRRGRALLRLLEQGAGPDIRIAWPEDAASRERLHSVLKTCFGMESVLMDRQGRLYTATGIPGAAQSPDTNRYSGFVRVVEGRMPLRERADLTALYERHGLSAGAVHAVRLFPRRADAMLLGGLSEILGGALPNGQMIAARYALEDNDVTITDLRSTGTPVPGTVRLQARPGCRVSS
ncbi:MAG: hypothetical protein R8L07_06485 [Alphaproteobacteria bacterium]|nr:hypothetical protein [Alphaproteobacteria bacterium]